MAVSSLNQLFKAVAPVKKEGDKTISYSQYAMWSSCPQKWKLTYVDKIRLGGPSIHTVFGSAFHDTIQWYLHIMFSDSVKATRSALNCAPKLISCSVQGASAFSGARVFSNVLRCLTTRS